MRNTKIGGAVRKINKLPPKYKALAKKRMNEAIRRGEVRREDNDLLGAFEWENSPEDKPFWKKVFLAKDVTELPPIPQED